MMNNGFVEEIPPMKTEMCCEKRMKITSPPWKTLGFPFHPQFYSECEVCGKKYLQSWSSCGMWEDGKLVGLPGYYRRELSEEEIERRMK